MGGCRDIFIWRNFCKNMKTAGICEVEIGIAYCRKTCGFCYGKLKLKERAGPQEAGPQERAGPQEDGPKERAGPQEAGPQERAGPQEAGPQERAGPLEAFYPFIL